MTADVTLAEAAVADAPAIAALHTANWRSTYRGLLPDAYLDGPLAEEHRAAWSLRVAAPLPGQALYVLRPDPQRDGGAQAAAAPRIAGFVCVLGGQDAEAGTLVENLHVARTHRGRGFGRRLLAAVAGWSAQHHPSDGVHLWALQGNAAARRFYEGCGARVTRQGVWDSPAGVAVAELRYAWDSPMALRAALDAVPRAGGHNDRLDRR